MEGLDPVKRMEADPNYINAVSIFKKSLSSYPQNHLNIQIQSGIRFFIPIHITHDPF